MSFDSQTSPWCSSMSEDCIETLATDPENGLTDEVAHARLAQYGPNKLAEEVKTPKWKVFLSQFQDFTIYVLIVAVIISAFEGQIPETVAILTILLLNGVLGFVQEYRAEEALAALKEMSAPTATVIRDGVEQEIDTVTLVPGDIILLESGDTVPADARLIEVGALRTIESALTGESEAVRKTVDPVDGEAIPLGDMRNVVFSGTAVSVGRGKGVVVETGTHTEMGKIATMLNNTIEDQTPIQVELDRVGKRVAVAVLIIAVLVFIEELFVGGGPITREVVTAGMLVAVSLAVAAIPEGLPAIVTVALSLGVRRMADKNAIVKKLHAVETLGSTDFICSDKTGTLTLNKMSARRLLVGLDSAKIEHGEIKLDAGHELDSQGLRTMLLVGLSCNDAHYTAAGELVGDPTETALVDAAQKLMPGLEVPPRIDEIPFDSERKRMTTVHSYRNDSLYAFVKGGTDTTVPHCTHALIDGETVELTEEIRSKIAEKNAEFAATGFRTLAFAIRELPDGANTDDFAAIESGLTYLGIIGLQDPARPEVPASIALAHSAGIKVAMVTGDHALTARAIAEEIGILDEGGTVVSGPEIEGMSDEELRNRVENIRVYARVNPEHKLRIVDALKNRGHIVAMTGDGVNDAPALKRADIGIAMGMVGTDVTREAADMVLADDNFATIVEAVEEGRSVFDNLKKVILFLLSCNISEVVIISLTSFFSPSAALLPLQILWINLITDGLPALALGVDPAEKGIMGRKPRNAAEPILTGARWFQIAWQGFILSIFPLILGYVIAPRLGASDAASRTMLFTTLVLSQLLHTMTFRSESNTIFSIESLKNKWLLGAITGSIIFQLLLIYAPGTEKLFRVVPLNAADWIAVVGVTLMSIFVIDVSKVIGARLKKD
ncbi:MAG: calcium-translocating P-type ATPase, PMCA-type [Coriobacteriia bacterium]|nr:calcium-translocating P-type ATPase, PMCA-type [Coriobacteriia bacterium]